MKDTKDITAWAIVSDVGILGREHLDIYNSEQYAVWARDYMREGHGKVVKVSIRLDEE